MKPKDAAKRIIQVLKREGVIIQRYDAYSSNSIYLKLDYGACHTIRISDHLGKKHLKYKYNLLSNLDEFKVKKGPPVQYFHPMSDIDIMIGNILAYRESLISRNHGMFIYGQHVKLQKLRNENNSGFWQQAVIV
jgi:hypothetical protein